MRKPISILLVIAMLLSVLSALTFTVSAEDEEEFTAVNLSLGYDIGMTYYTNIDYASNVTAQVTINGRTDTVRATNSNGKAAFSFNGIAPHELGSAITAEVYKGTTASEAVKETAIKDICALYLDNTFDTYEEETRDGIYKLVSNLLQYGECARIYKNVPDSILTDITSENYVPDTLGTPTGDKTTGNGNENLSLRGLSVFFDTTNRYYIKFATTDISKVRFTVGSTAYTEFGEEGGYYFFYTNPMSAKDTNNVVSIKGYYDNEKAIDVNYSIEQYIIDLQSNSASESMLNLAKSIYNYSEAANEYTQLDFTSNDSALVLPTVELYTSPAPHIPAGEITDYIYYYPVQGSSVAAIKAGNPTHGDEVIYGDYIYTYIDPSYYPDEIDFVLTILLDAFLPAGADLQPFAGWICTGAGVTPYTDPYDPSDINENTGFMDFIDESTVDRERESYGPIAQEIHGSPVVYLAATFDSCVNVVEFPAIPYAVVRLRNTYANSSLTEFPFIPSSVELISDAFDNCSIPSGETLYLNTNTFTGTPFGGLSGDYYLGGRMSDAKKQEVIDAISEYENANVTISHSNNVQLVTNSENALQRELIRFILDSNIENKVIVMDANHMLLSRDDIENEIEAELLVNPEIEYTASQILNYIVNCAEGIALNDLTASYVNEYISNSFGEQAAALIYAEDTSEGIVSLCVPYIGLEIHVINNNEANLMNYTTLYFVFLGVQESSGIADKGDIEIDSVHQCKSFVELVNETNEALVNYPEITDVYGENAAQLLLNGVFEIISTIIGTETICQLNTAEEINSGIEETAPGITDYLYVTSESGEKTIHLSVIDMEITVINKTTLADMCSASAQYYHSMNIPASIFEVDSTHADMTSSEIMAEIETFVNYYKQIDPSFDFPCEFIYAAIIDTSIGITVNSASDINAIIAQYYGESVAAALYITEDANTRTLHAAPIELTVTVEIN